MLQSSRVVQVIIRVSRLRLCPLKIDFSLVTPWPAYVPRVRRPSLARILSPTTRSVDIAADGAAARLEIHSSYHGFWTASVGSGLPSEQHAYVC